MGVNDFANEVSAIFQQPCCQWLEVTGAGSEQLCRDVTRSEDVTNVSGGLHSSQSSLTQLSELRVSKAEHVLLGSVPLTDNKLSASAGRYEVPSNSISISAVDLSAVLYSMVKLQYQMTSWTGLYFF